MSLLSRKGPASGCFVVAVLALLALPLVAPCQAHGLPTPAKGTLQPATELPPSLRIGDDRISVLVRLEGEPAWRRFRDAGGRRSGAALRQAAEASARLALQQDAFVQSAAALGATPGRRLQFIDNVVVVEIAASRLRELARLPGVVALGPNRRYQRAHTASMPLINASDAWAGMATSGLPYTGQGVTIGIIDEGIDYTHRHFGGEGNYEANDRTVLGDVAWPPAAPPAAMGDQLVIGGHDFVGDDYSAGLVPQPDPDPAGCPFSHGTHVAGTAAGYGVLIDGSTFTGNLGQGTLNLFPDLPLASVNHWRIGPGAAPRANLVSLRVFGCSGSTGTDILLAAMEHAATQTFLGQGIDVVNMSLGSAYGGTSPDDFLNGAQQALVELGIVVVASAGNNGDVQLVTGAPGSAAGTISVANVTDTGAVIEGRFTYAESIPAAKSLMYPEAGPDPLLAGIAIASPIQACSVLVEPGANAWDGKWLVVDRGNCEFSVKVAHVKATGAAGAIVVNNTLDPPFVMGRGGSALDDELPSIMIGQFDGSTLKALVVSTPQSGTFDGSVVSAVLDTPGLVAASSSRGGVVRGSGGRILKPNLAAPGASITSAGAGTNDLGYTIGGTSMASPHVAGLAALLIEAHGRPVDAAGVALVKQRLMSTVTLDIGESTPGMAPFRSPQRIGAGLVDAIAALDTQLVAYAADAPENGALSFGYPRQVVGAPPLQQVKQIILRNLGNASVELATGYLPRSTWPGATVAVSPAEVQVPPLGEVAVEVTLTVDAEHPGLNVSGDPTYAASSQVSFLHEVSGYATFTVAATNESIRVPVYAAPHLTADTAVQDILVVADPVGISALPIGGTGFDLGGSNNDHVALVSAFQLVASSGLEEGMFWDADGSGSDDPDELLSDYRAADIAHVGAVVQDFGGGETLMTLGLAMHGEWTSPKDILFEVYIDTDDDGNDDILWYNSLGASDQYVTSFVVLSTGEAYTFSEPLNLFHGGTLDSMLFRNNVVLLPLRLSNAAFPSLGVPNYTGGPIPMSVVTYQRDTDFTIPVDMVQARHTQALSLTTPSGIGNLAIANGGNSFSIDHDFTGLASLPSILSLHHHQHDPARRAQVTELYLASSLPAVFKDGFED